MEIVITAGGMPFGPTTLNYKSLGGSETAVIMLAQEIKKRGHLVTVFCDLPADGEPDFHNNGDNDECGVRWLHSNNYQQYVQNTQMDLLICSRDPRLVAIPAQARKKVLYCHDIATYRGMGLALDQMQWTFDEVWAVSKWYKRQIHKVTDYPLNNIKVIPNGIVPIDTIPAPRSETQLVYAARPERGLANLIREGGIMEQLPEFTLKVAMYNHFPDEMKDFYQWCYHRIDQLPNVEMLGSLRQQEMRQLLADSAAYIYPTQFEETSCIIARECMSVGTPFISTSVGALEETLGGKNPGEYCGIFFEKWLRGRFLHTKKFAKLAYEGLDHKEIPEPGSTEWCELFAIFFKDFLKNKSLIKSVQRRMGERTDLYWDTAAKAALRNAKPKPVKVFSRAWSLVQDGDVISAYAFLSAQDKLDVPSKELANQIEQFYPFMLDESDANYESLSSYYKRFYEFKKPDICYGIDYARGTHRFQAIKRAVERDTKPGDTIVEYGCGEGHVSGPLAKDLPDRRFLAFDQVQQNVDMVNKFEEDFGTTNLKAYRVDTPWEAEQILFNLRDEYKADLVICVEVLEHCVRPWEVATDVEALVKDGGQVVITTPYGAWEPMSFETKPEEFKWRNHIWHLDKTAVRIMFGGKPEMEMISLASGHGHDGRAIGNLFYTYKADHKKIKPLDPLKKALDAHSRQAIGIAAICMNDEEVILKMLHSINREVQFVQFAMGPSTDNTRSMIEKFFEEHPHMQYRIIDVPKITPEYIDDKGVVHKGYSFGMARNASTEGVKDWFDWILWMDTDEYLSGSLGHFARHNSLDAYLLAQHHFTVAPRGGPTQIDRPARLFRTGRGYLCSGHIHEHFEIPKGGPGRCFMLPNVDLGHTGYKNENIRKERFNRNFPFLVWDHKVNPDRRLGKFLWFRDIVHRMRFHQQENDMDRTLGLAEEAEKYYTENWKFMASFGTGTFQAIEYLAEARKLLNIGMDVEVIIRLENREAILKGRFRSTEEINRIQKQILDSEFKRRESKYY